MKTRHLFRARCLVVLIGGIVAGLLPILLGGIPGLTAPALMFEPIRILLLAAGIPLMGAWFAMTRRFGWMKDPDEPKFMEEAGVAFLPMVTRTMFFYFTVFCAFLCPMIFLAMTIPGKLAALGLLAGFIAAAMTVTLFGRFGWKVSQFWVEREPSEISARKVWAWVGTILIIGIVMAPELAQILSGSPAPMETLGKAVAKVIAAFLAGGIIGKGSHGKINWVALAVGIAVHLLFLAR